jgi:tetratricopeptide (TPR) repeat protein
MPKPNDWLPFLRGSSRVGESPPDNMDSQSNSLGFARMDHLKIKYAACVGALPPRPIRLEIGGWSGADEKMVDGSNPQPWHCLPFVEGSTYGLELIYPHETPCDVVNANGAVRFDWNYAGEPGGGLTGAEFLLFAPVKAAKYYMFNTRLDLQAPPGYSLRTEPHPRYYTDETGTFPLALVGHLQSEWYSRKTFVVFRAPQPGQRHIFRKGEPFAQILFVVKKVTYELEPMSPNEERERGQRERDVQAARYELATNHWRPPDGVRFNNHYKILARAHAVGGSAGVEETIRAAFDKRDRDFPLTDSVPECLALGLKLQSDKRYEDAHRFYAHVLSLEPNNPEALCQIGFCIANLGSFRQGLQLIAAATTVAPRVSKYHKRLGEYLRQLGRLKDAEASLRTALGLSPNDPEILSLLGSIMEQQGEHGEARICYEAALAADPQFAPAQRCLQNLLAKAES